LSLRVDRHGRRRRYVPYYTSYVAPRYLARMHRVIGGMLVESSHVRPTHLFSSASHRIVSYKATVRTQCCGWVPAAAGDGCALHATVPGDGRTMRHRRASHCAVRVRQRAHPSAASASPHNSCCLYSHGTLRWHTTVPQVFRVGSKLYDPEVDATAFYNTSAQSPHMQSMSAGATLPRPFRTIPELARTAHSYPVVVDTGIVGTRAAEISRFAPNPRPFVERRFMAIVHPLSAERAWALCADCVAAFWRKGATSKVSRLCTWGSRHGTPPRSTSPPPHYKSIVTAQVPCTSPPPCVRCQ